MNSAGQYLYIIRKGRNSSTGSEGQKGYCFYYKQCLDRDDLRFSSKFRAGYFGARTREKLQQKLEMYSKRVLKMDYL